jgi:protein-S-isoprenylcysteine O-methyltransferase Ste14
VSAASKPPLSPRDSDPGKAEGAKPKPSAKPSASPDSRPHRAAPTIWQRAVYRWVAVTVVMAALLVMYTQHPYYKDQQFTPFKTLYPTAFFVWLAVGILYVKVTLEKFGDFRYMMRDNGLHFLLLAKAWQRHKFWRVAKNRRVKTTLLGIIVKGFFTPLMFGFVTGHLNNISRSWLNHKHLAPIDFKAPSGTHALEAAKMWWTHVGSRLGDFVPTLHDLGQLLQPWAWSRPDFSWGLDLTYNMVFAVDCGWALFGYCTDSRWLGNKTKSVEPTAFGWAVCLACYPPFNNVLGTYLPLRDGTPLDLSISWLGLEISADSMHLAFRAITVLLFSIYAAATVSFGMRFSNLTNRGVISRGPYRFVRHPAYLCKCTAWWLEHIPTMTMMKAFFLTLLCGVYSLRAWTEERHLSKDPDYVAYKKKVPWVLFPGVY